MEIINAVLNFECPFKDKCFADHCIVKGGESTPTLDAEMERDQSITITCYDTKLKPK